MDAGLQQSNALYATGMNEKEIESAEQLYVADSEPTRLRDERVQRVQRVHQKHIFKSIKC